jgi:1,2-phenylacetyl-CoA epoxidase catalytic subunit
MTELISSEKELLTQMLVSHAYREKLAAVRFEEALSFLPAGETGNYWLNVIAEEEEHYQGCLHVANELNIELEPLVMARMSKQPLGIPPFCHWLDVLLAHAFNDKAGYYVLLGLIESKVKPYAALAGKIVAQEESHGTCGAAALVKYYPTQEVRDHLKRDALARYIDAAIRCLGRPNTLGDRKAVRFRLKTKSASETIREFCSYVRGILNQLPDHDQLIMTSLNSISESENGSLFL